MCCSGTCFCRTSGPTARNSLRNWVCMASFHSGCATRPATRREMLDAGIEAILTCVDLRKLDASFAGRRFDDDLLRSLPAGTDPCGENGEFHTFVSAGPMFSASIPVSVGDTVQREGFAFADLLPVRCPARDNASQKQR